jgi:hypothetical protein
MKVNKIKLQKGESVTLGYLSSGLNYKLFENDATYCFRRGNNYTFSFPGLSSLVCLNLKRILFIKAKGKNDNTTSIPGKGNNCWD